MNFLLNLYIPLWLSQSFKFLVLRLLQIHLWVKKLYLFIFTCAPKQNSPQGFYHYPPSRWELPIPIEQRFWRYFFTAEKVEGVDYGVRKISKTRIHWLARRIVRKLLDIMPTYHYVQNQRKLMMQSREKGQKPQLGQFFDDFEVKYLQIANLSEK